MHVQVDPAKKAYRVGVAFPKEKNGFKYFSVNIESPLFPASLNAALFTDKEKAGEYNLVWSRLEPEGLKAEATLSVNSQTNRRRFPAAHATP